MSKACRAEQDRFNDWRKAAGVVATKTTAMHWQAFKEGVAAKNYADWYRDMWAIDARAQRELAVVTAANPGKYCELASGDCGWPSRRYCILVDNKRVPFPRI